jgi:putative SOS response-associated peptidase YedK
VCGRYSLAAEADELVEVFDVPPVSFHWPRRFNVAPGQEAPVVAEDRHGRRMGLLRWGFVPSWAQDTNRPFINARAERAHETPSFREAFAHRRCLVPADGFYEWRRDEGGKRPFWFQATAGGLLTLAAIWERWDRPGRQPRHGFAILTVDANDDVGPVHDRMPLLVASGDRDLWLGGGASLDDLARLVAPPPEGTLVAREVSSRVNAPSEDDSGLIEPV